MNKRAKQHLARRRRKRSRRAKSSGIGFGRRLLRGVASAGVAILASTLLLILPFRWIDPPTSSIILQRHVRAYSESRPAPVHRWRDRNQIAVALGKAVVVAEDQKFLDHFGFDFKSIADAANSRKKRPRGASTISQQVVKNLYLWPGRSWLRKGIEAYLTLGVEALWPKERILEIYLNIAEFGPDVFGAESASRLHFGKPAARLTTREAALLAAVLPNPSRLSAGRPSEYVRGRADEIESQLAQLHGSRHLRNL